MPIYSRMAKYFIVSSILNTIQPFKKKKKKWIKLDDLEEFSSITELKEKNLLNNPQQKYMIYIRLHRITQTKKYRYMHNRLLSEKGGSRGKQ